MNSSPRQQATQHFVYAAAAALLIICMMLFLPIPWVWDINDPEFMPLIVLYPFLGIWGGYHLLNGLTWVVRARKFGNAKLELQGPPPRLGGRLRGKVVVKQPVRATGDYRIVLQYVELHEHDRYDAERRRTRDYVIWEQAVSAPAGTDATQGIPFSIPLPDQVRTPQPEPRKPNAIRHEYSYSVPLLGKIWTNRAPVGAFWQLVVTAPTTGTDFRATIPVDIGTR
jgi:hypothetical protein